MKTRFVLRSPLGDTVERDVADGCWQEPAGDADATIGAYGWALPGLVDAHSHIAAGSLDYQPGNLSEAQQRARMAVRVGVMLLLDKGWTDTTAIETARSVPTEERPDIEAAATIISVADGYVAGFTHEVGPGEVEEAVDEEAERGTGWVKLIGDWPRRGVGPVANFTTEELEIAVAAAEAAGSRVAIHTMARDVPSAAVAAGVHSIEHGLFLTEEDIAILGSRSGMWVPTVLRVDDTIAQLGPDSSGGQLLAEGLANVERLLPLAQEAGVHVLAGTDLIGSAADVADEAIRMASAGLTPRQVVHAIGRAGFLATGRSADFEIGSPANAVFFPEDPTGNVSVLGYPSAVLRMGSLL